MEFRCTREDLLAPLTAAAGAIESKTLPMLQNVLLDAAGTIQGTNLETEITARWKTEGEGRVTVDAKKLKDVIRQLPEGAPVDGVLEGGRLRLRSGRARFLLATLPVENWPAFDGGALGEAMPMDAGVLADGIEACAFCMASQDVRYYLNGLALEAARGVLTLVASDGHRMAKFEAETGAEFPRVIVPRRAVLQVQKFLADCKALTIAVGQPGADSVPNVLSLDFGPVALATKLIEGRFPEWQRVWPRDLDRTVSVGRTEALAAIKLVAVISHEKYKSMVFEAGPGELRVTAKNAEQEDAVATVEALLEGGPVSLGFNAVYLAEALSHCRGDRVTVGVTAGGNSTLITGEDSRVGYVVMPMRV